ncbi:MAG: hypothetical protein HYZ75_00805 [Elusimicrobia bacterium]|nr:hypothetical protein [Elusimicrobiota bacterium]
MEVKTGISLGTGNQSYTFDKKHPRGLITEYALAVNGTIALDGGTAASNPLRVVRSVDVETDLHGKIIEGVDGKGLYRLGQILFGLDLAAAIASTSFRVPILLPLHNMGNRLWQGMRPFDTALWATVCKPVVTVALGPVTDLVTGGTAPTVTSVQIALSARYKPNPTPEKYDPANGLFGDLPEGQLYIQRVQIPAYAAGAVEAPLPIGQGRRLLGIFFSQRNTSTDAEVDTEVTANSTVISIKHGEDFPVYRKLVSQMKDENLAQFGVLPSGWFAAWFNEYGRIIDGLDLRDISKELTVRFENLAATSNQNIYMYLVSVKPPKEGSQPA